MAPSGEVLKWPWATSYCAENFLEVQQLRELKCQKENYLSEKLFIWSELVPFQPRNNSPSVQEMGFLVG